MSTLCAQIRAARLTRTERRVADVVLANPAAALRTATARLAEAAQVSQPQVIRFCRALGFDGVSSFKHALAASLGGVATDPGHPLLTRSLQALAHVDPHRLADAARLLARAPRIDVWTDVDRAPLQDLALGMLWRLGLPARPAQPAARAPVSLALGASAPWGAATTVLITEQPQPRAAALQLVTGNECAAAPTLLATLMLQLLLAEIAQDQCAI
ncbi:hypothetical protein [Roseateles asaccharophilus]|uniref:HTH rpiR-type domain-containing protein n=1 Tax=Roseateles asaccharophilus TaxID=582607 RepID=A0ABU2A6T3_9BURK|nr:hypothetical protein [Roseateles asaccharophilus]MDR7332914.1 hypothetical protein [Roseateles asaccharophilus]